MICPTESGPATGATASLTKLTRGPNGFGITPGADGLGSGKPTITPKTPFPVNDLHHQPWRRRGIDRALETVDNHLFATRATYNSTAPEKNFSTMSADLWQRGCERLAAELPEQQFNTWIRPLPAADVTDGVAGDAVVTVRVPNRFKLDWIRNQYAGRIEAVLTELAGKPVRLEIALAPRDAVDRPAANAPMYPGAANSAARGVVAWLAFHTGAPVTPRPADAHFALVSSPGELIALEDFAQGSQEYPDRSTTLILQLARLEPSGPLVLEGPGIRRRQRLEASPLPRDFEAQWLQNRGRFPRGVDLILAGPGALACLPRTTRIMVEEG